MHIFCQDTPYKYKVSIPDYLLLQKILSGGWDFQIGMEETAQLLVKHKLKAMLTFYDDELLLL